MLEIKRDLQWSSVTEKNGMNSNKVLKFLGHLSCEGREKI